MPAPILKKSISFARGSVSRPALAVALIAFATPSFADDAVIDLGTVKVEDQSNNTLTRSTGLPGLPSTIQDTPQAINVITQQTLREQGVTTLEQALRNVPGITVAIGEGGTLNGDQFKIRGFDAKDDVYLDGLRDFGVYTRDSFNYEEVQVLKGPSGAMFGRGTVGGAINTRSKTPKLEDFTQVDGFIGNGDYYRGLVDVNRQIDDTTALRINFMAASTGVVDRDNIESMRWGIAPSIGFGLGTKTTITLSYLHQQDDRIPDYGIPAALRPGQLLAEPASENGVPRSNFLQFNTDKDNSTADIITARINHEATPWLVLTNDSRIGVYSRSFAYTTIDRCDLTAATNFCANTLFGPTPQNTVAGIGGSGPYNQDSFGIQDIATARADFTVGDFKNQAILGLDVSYQSNDKSFSYYTLPTTAQYFYALGDHTQARTNIAQSLFFPNNNPPPGYAPMRVTATTFANTNATATSVNDASGNATDIGLFFTDRIWLNDALSVIGSIRWDHYEANYTSVTVGNVTTNLTTRNDLINPRASIVFEPTPDQTYYVSWGKSATPQGTSIVGSGTALAASSSSLDPEESETVEIGAKVGFFDGMLGLTGSAFVVTKSNALLTDPLTGIAQVQSGQRQRMLGYELGATGKITDTLTLNASYTYLQSKVTQDFSCSTTGVISCKLNPFSMSLPVFFVPKHSASSWISYDAVEMLPGLSFSSGFTYQSRLVTGAQYTGAAPNLTGFSRVVTIPENFSLDGVVAYTFDNVRLAMNVYNITDRLNYGQVFGNRGTPTAGRTFIFSLGLTY